MTNLVILFAVSSAHAVNPQDPCWANERSRMACFKEVAIKDGSFAKNANPKNAKKKDADGTTILHMLAASNSVSEAKTLLAAGADVNAISRIHGSPLNVAAQETQIEMVDLLLSHGANPNTRDLNGFTPMISTLWQNNPVGEGIDTEAQGAIVDSLIKYKANLDLPGEFGDYPLCIAVFNSNFRQKFLAAGASPNLHVSPYIMPNEKSKPLSKWFDTLPALACATEKDNRSMSFSKVNEAISDLLAAGAKADSRGHSGNSALMNLAANDNVEGIKLLLQARAPANAKNNYGQNALMIAVLRTADPKIIEVLLPLTNLKAKDIYGRSIRDYLAQKNRPEEINGFGSNSDLGFNWTIRKNPENPMAPNNFGVIKDLFQAAGIEPNI